MLVTSSADEFEKFPQDKLPRKFQDLQAAFAELTGGVLDDAEDDFGKVPPSQKFLAVRSHKYYTDLFGAIGDTAWLFELFWRDFWEAEKGFWDRMFMGSSTTWLFGTHGKTSLKSATVEGSWSFMASLAFA